LSIMVRRSRFEGKSGSPVDWATIAQELPSSHDARVASGFGHVNRLVRLPDGRRVMIRFDQPGRDDLDLCAIAENSVLRVLDHCRTRLRVPRVLATGRVGGRPFSVHTFVGETRGFTHRQPQTGHRPHVVAGVARELARLPAWALDALEAEQRSSPMARMSGGADTSHEGLVRAQLDHVVARAEAELGHAREALGLPHPSALRREMGAHLPRAETGRPRTLVHGDLHDDNIVWVKRRQGNVIDFERSLVGDPAHDLAVYLKRGTRAYRPDRAAFLRWWTDAIPGEDQSRLDAAERRFRLCEDLGEMYRLLLRRHRRQERLDQGRPPGPEVDAYPAIREGFARLGIEAPTQARFETWLRDAHHDRPHARENTTPPPYAPPAESQRLLALIAATRPAPAGLRERSRKTTTGPTPDARHIARERHPRRAEASRSPERGR